VTIRQKRRHGNDRFIPGLQQGPGKQPKDIVRPVAHDDVARRHIEFVRQLVQQQMSGTVRISVQTGDLPADGFHSPG
jgi:hypothetical protein